MACLALLRAGALEKQMLASVLQAASARDFLNAGALEAVTRGRDLQMMLVCYWTLAGLIVEISFKLQARITRHPPALATKGLAHIILETAPPQLQQSAYCVYTPE